MPFRHGRDFVTLYNLSPGGCMIAVPGDFVEVGDPVSVNLMDIERAAGKVVWIKDRNCGVQFDCEIPQAIVEHLGFVASSHRFEQQEPRDRFGNTIEVDPEAPGEMPDFPDDLLESAELQEDRRRHDRGQDDRSQHQRISVDAKASLFVSYKDKTAGRLFDLSTHGCCMELSFGKFAVGDQVWLKIDPIEPWRGTVRWTDGKLVGVEFERPFYPAVFDQIVRSKKVVRLDLAA